MRQVSFSLIMIICFSCTTKNMPAIPNQNNELSYKKRYETICKNDQCVVLDKATKLYWQRDFLSSSKYPLWGMRIAKAASYCEELEYGGYVDWSLPTAQEGASVIYGCNKIQETEICGLAKVSAAAEYIEKCLCSPNNGPGEKGYYLFPGVWGEMNGRNIQWTSSRAPNSGLPIAIAYFSGIASVISEDYPAAGVRCVRKDEKK